MPTPIPYGRQSIDDTDLQAVAAVLRSPFLTQGPAAEAFESAVALRVGAGHALATTNATAALHLACLALGLGPGDRLWTSPITFVASANVGLMCGAEVDFVDIDPLTYNLSVTALEAKLQAAQAQQRLPKIVMPVHLCGQPCDMAAIGRLSRQYGFRVIEDASHAIGARDQGAPVGSCTWSDITVFSFHPVKIITTGEGGMALTNDPTLADRMRRLRSHGLQYTEAGQAFRADGEIWNYTQEDLGFNYRMTDLQAALGLSQLQRLDTFLARRQTLAARYDSLLLNLAIQRPHQLAGTESSYHLYPIGVDRQQAVYQGLRDLGIMCNLHYIPVYLQPFYARMGFRRGLCPNAETYFKRCISLPLHAELTNSEQDFIVDALQKVLT